MNFKKEIPKTQGYYFYVDKEYPIPKIGFVYWVGTIPRIQDGISDQEIFESQTRGYRFGDKIQLPDCKDNVIE